MIKKMGESLKDKKTEKERREEKVLNRVREIWSDDKTFVQYVHASEG
jgi:hypothetical protein